jgi:predicted DCC family thiol-disulfide oxidoreductase YuxK
MKINNKTLVYDDACPLCVWYTGAFVKTGLLESEERKPFSAASPELLHHINWQRSKNEIPLLDIETNQVLYGIDALLEILGQRFPLIKTTGNYKPVKWFLKKLYSFISYNRKVIVARKAAPGTIDCTPDYNVFYRALFMTVFLVFNTLMLFPIHHFLQQLPYYHLSAAGLQLLHSVLVLVNCLLAVTLITKKPIEYLGQVNMLALVTVLLLVPLIIINKVLPGAGWIIPPYLFGLTLFIIKEYFRRMDYAGIIPENKLIVVINLMSMFAFVACLFIL